MTNIWFTSDTHYSHKNIIKGISSWSDKSTCRNFLTLEEHNKTLVDNINQVVKEDDILYHLGDWSFGGIEQIWDFRKQINCKTIHLILGNHDEHIENNKEIKIYNDGIKINPKLLEIHIQYACPDYTCIVLQNLFASVSHYKEIKINKNRFILSHWPMRVWNKAHHGSIMLHGHCHGNLDDYKDMDNFLYKTMDVGIDTHKQFRPYNISEIIDIMNKRIKLSVDHHNELTRQ